MKVLNYGSLNVDYVYSVDHIIVGGETQHSSKLEVNKIAARWPAKAVAQLFTFSKKGSDRIVPR